MNQFLRFVISIGLLGYVFSLIDISEISQAVAHVDWWYLFVALGVMTITRLLMPFKWNLLLQEKDINLPLSECIKLYYVSSFVGLALPATVGADALRLYLMSKRNFRVSDVLSSIVVERLIGFIVMVLFAGAGAMLMASYFGALELPLTAITIIVVVVTCILIAFIVSLCNKYIGKRLRLFLEKISDNTRLKTIVEKLVFLHSSLLGYKKYPLTLLVFFLLAAVEAVLAYIVVYFVVVGFDIPVPSYFLFAFLPIQFLLIRIPISFAGWGVHEAGFIYFLSFVGISTTEGLSIGLLHHVVILLALLPGFFGLLANKNYLELTRARNVVRSST